MNTKLAGKSDTSHSHAWSAITDKPNTFSPSSHNHDDKYYTEAEVRELLKNTMIWKAADGNTAHTLEKSVTIQIPAEIVPKANEYLISITSSSFSYGVRVLLTASLSNDVIVPVFSGGPSNDTYCKVWIIGYNANNKMTFGLDKYEISGKTTPALKVRVFYR